MSNLLLFQDNASSLLASGITNVATTLTVTATTGALFSAPGAGQYALGTIEDVSGNIEVVQITSRTSDSFVIVRGQEGTAAQAFASGSRFEQRVTAGMLALFLQKTGADTLSGTTTLSGILTLGAGGSIRSGELAGTAIRSQPGDTSNQILVPIGSPATAAGSVILTAANLLGNLASGVGVNTTGMIMLWYGTAGSVPTGYHICDGTAGTPDLRDLFVLGAGGALPTTGGSSTTVTGSGGGGGGSVTGGYALVPTDLPAHTHDVYMGQNTTAGALAGVIGSATPGAGYVSNNASSTPLIAHGGNGTGAGNPHTHTVTPSPVHTHTYSLPPYRALYYIMKT